MKRCKNDINGPRENCIRELVDVWSQLLPKSKVKDINANAVKFLDTAIQLRNDMTEEQAVNRCVILVYSESVTNVNFNIGDERDLN